VVDLDELVVPCLVVGLLGLETQDVIGRRVGLGRPGRSRVFAAGAIGCRVRSGLGAVEERRGAFRRGTGSVWL
jgi:hypothetical protein